MRSFRRFFLIISLLVFTAFFSGILSAQEGAEDVQAIEKLLSTKISTVTKYERTSSKVPASVTIITSEDIERYGYRSLIDVFMSVPGFYTSYDRNYNYLGARGFSRPTDYNDRILLLVNGHSLNESMYGSVPVGTDLGIELESIERIEIVRGPHSALYGTGAMFSVINIITKKGNALNGFRLAGEFGSYRRLKGSALFGKKFKNNTDVFVSGQWTDIGGQDLYFKEYDDPSTNDGIAHNLDWDKYFGFLTTISNGDFSLLGSVMSRKKGIPTAAYEMDFNDARAESLDSLSFIEAKFDHNLSVGSSFMARAYYNHYYYEGYYPTGILYTDKTTANWAGGEAQFRWDFRPNNRLIFGAEYQRHIRADYKYWSEESTIFDGNFPFHIFSLYLQDEYQIRENLSFTLGVRHDRYSTFGNSTTPRLGIVYSPFKPSTFKLLYGEAFRAPNAYEANYEDPLSGFKRGPSLRPEKIRTSEIIWEQKWGDYLFTTVDFYDYRMRNLIDQAIDPVDELIQFQNIGRVKAVGLELALNARWKNGIWGYASYTFENPKDVILNERLTNSPKRIIKSGFSVPVMNLFMVSGSAQYETERTTVYGTKTDSYFLANFNIASDLLWDHLKVSLLVRNLFDTTYSLPGGFEHRQPAIIQDKRNFVVKIEYIF